MARHRKRPWPRTLGQGLTRRWRIGSQDIPWQVASQQSLPPLLLTMAFDQEAVSLCNRWTSEPCLEKSHRFTAIPPNSALNHNLFRPGFLRASVTSVVILCQSPTLRMHALQRSGQRLSMPAGDTPQPRVRNSLAIRVVRSSNRDT